jgi:hypothetical protein
MAAQVRTQPRLIAHTSLVQPHTPSPPSASNTPPGLRSRARLDLPRAGLGLNEFCTAVGYCRATYYNLPLDVRPRSVLIGRRRIIIEQPAEYLARLAGAQNDGAGDELAA